MREHAKALFVSLSAVSENVRQHRVRVPAFVMIRGSVVHDGAGLDQA